MRERDSSTPSLFTELKRRRVFRAATAYAAGAFVLLEAADLLLVPGWAYRLLIVVVVAGFPVTLVLSWLFELTPEGLRRAVGGAPDRLVVPLRPLLTYGGTGLLLLLLLGSSALWLRSRASGQVARGAEVIAVVPFVTNGIGVEGMREGIVDLLARNLDQIGAIRTVDPRTVLRRWHERGGDGLPREQLLEIGRDVEAGSVLTGSVVSAGGKVRIQAELLGLDGGRLATTSVEGEESRTLELVDSLSVSLLREIWRSREPVPRFDLATVTSTSPDALRAFLAGEQLLRVSDWRAAADAFERAIEADSAFALALFRLYQVAGWTGAISRPREWFLEAAERHADRLPERTRSLLVAERAIAEGRRREAIDSLQRLTRRYPDDAEIWLGLAEAHFHQRDEGAGHAAPPVREQLRHFERALELDPGYLPALVHPLEVAFLYEDTARVRRYLGMVGEIASVPPTALDILERGAATLGEDTPLVELISTLGLVLTTLDEERVDLRWQAAKATLPPLRRRVVLLPAEDGTVILRWLEGRAREDTGEFGGWAADFLVETLVATGRLDRAGELLRTAEHPALRNPGARRSWSALPVLAGIDLRGLDVGREEAAAGDDPGRGREASGVGPTQGTVGGVAGEYPDGWSEAARSATPAGGGASVELAAALDREDAGALRSLASRLERDASSAAEDAPGGRVALARLARSFARGFAGNEAALGEVESGLTEAAAAGPTSAFPWYEAAWLRWLEIAVDRPGHRQGAVARLERPWPGSAAYEPRRLLALARGLHAVGRDDEAADAVRRASAALAAADSGLTLGARLAALGEALGGVAGPDDETDETPDRSREAG